MSLSELCISPPEAPSKKRNQPKSRVFSVRMLGYLAANALWDAPTSGNHIRPAWIAYLATDQAMRPFTANFRGGRPATGDSSKTFAMPKKSAHRWVTQRVPGASVTLAYLPELFHLEPAMVEDHCRFIFAPPRWWVEAQAATLTAEFGDDAHDAARAALFTAFLDRRTPMPIVNDLRFHLQLYRAALEAGRNHPWAIGHLGCHGGCLSGSHHPGCGLDLPVAVNVSQSDLRRLIVEQTALFHQQELAAGRHRFAPPRQLLPLPSGQPEQLCLSFAIG
jgi:hypothetical protein